MPERIYFGKSLPELKTILDGLRDGLASGGLIELQVSGIRTQTSPVSQSDRRGLIADVRMEGYRVAQAMQLTDANRAQSILDWPDPRQENIRRVESIHGCRPLGCL